MRTSLDLPEDLIKKAMEITRAKTKNELFKIALENIINQEEKNNMKKYHGKVNLEIDLDTLRER